MDASGPRAPDPVQLDPYEVVADRPFTAVENTERDLAILTGMLGDVRQVLDDIDHGRRIVLAFQKLVWQVEDLTHRLLITDEDRLRAHPRLCVVGFFGERHLELDPTPLEEANTAIVSEFIDYPGILSYGSIQIDDGSWANMVLHDHPTDRDYWRRNRRHAAAVRALSPVHYKNVRIHNAELTAPLAQGPSVVGLRTKYYDYSGSAPWHAERISSLAATPVDDRSESASTRRTSGSLFSRHDIGDGR